MRKSNLFNNVFEITILKKYTKALNKNKYL